MGSSSSRRAPPVARPRDFLRKFLPSRDLKITENLKRCSKVIHNTPCCAGGGGSRTPCGRKHRRPLARELPCAGYALARLHRVSSTAVFWVVRVVRELLGFPMTCRRFFVGVVGRTSDSTRSSDLSSRAAPRCPFCAWASDWRLKCLFSRFLSTSSLDDFEVRGSNFTRLKFLLSTFLSTSLDDFEALGANFALLERSWSLLGRISNF